MARLNPGECNMIYVMDQCSQVIIEYRASSRLGASKRPLSLILTYPSHNTNAFVCADI